MAYNAEKELCRADFDGHRRQKMSVYRAWHTAADDEPGVLVDKNELERWMLAELEAPKKNAGKKQVSQSVASSTDDDCVTVTASQAVRSPVKGSQAGQTNGATPKVNRHRQVTPGPQQQIPGNSKGKERAVTVPQSSQMEIDSTDDDSELPSAAEIANGSASTRRLMPGSLVIADKESPSADSRFREGDPHLRNGDAPQPRTLLENGVQAMDIDARQLDATEAGEAAAPPASYPAPTQPSESKPQNKLVSVTHLDSTAIRCPHGLVSIAKFAHMKRISLAGAAAIRELGVTFSPAFSDPDDLCKECVWTPWSDLAYAQKHADDVARYCEIQSKDHRHPVYISKKWLQTWQRDKPVFHEANGQFDLAPDWNSYGLHVTCRHGNLEPEEGARQMITSKVGCCGPVDSARGVMLRLLDFQAASGLPQEAVSHMAAKTG